MYALMGVTEYAKLRMDLNQESNVFMCNNSRTMSPIKSPLFAFALLGTPFGSHL